MELNDYQIAGIILIGIDIVMFVMLVIDDRKYHKELSVRRYCKRVIRLLFGIDDEPRVITSTNHLKH